MKKWVKCFRCGLEPAPFLCFILTVKLTRERSGVRAPLLPLKEEPCKALLYCSLTVNNFHTPLIAKYRHKQEKAAQTAFYIQYEGLCSEILLRLTPDAFHSGQIIYHFTRDDQSGHRRCKSSGARDIPSFRAFPCGSGRAYAVRPTANGHIFQGPYGFFPGIDNLQMLDASLLAFMTHYLGKGTDRGVIDIRNFKQ